MSSAEEIIASATSWKPLSERQARETYRTVYLVDNRYVVKKFELAADLASYRKPWITEDLALRRLEGRFAPRTIGYTERIEKGKRIAWLVKEYVIGTTCRTFSETDMPAVAALMAGLHKHLVVTDDANVQNFLVADDGRIRFIDLGRARVFDHRGPWLYLNIGQELAKLRREGFAWNQALWKKFLPAYFQALGCSHPARWMIGCSTMVATALRKMRKMVQGKSRWS